MKQIFYISKLLFIVLSYYNNSQIRNNNFDSKTNGINKTNEQGDSIYKIGDFLFEAKQNAKFEFVKRNEKPKLQTKGDTLYSDDQIVMLGDFQEIVSSGVYKKFTFKSKFDNFKVDKIYTGKLASPNFKTDPTATRFISMIKLGCKKEGVNFAGHYTIVEWGCGTFCAEMAIVDRITGKIIYSIIPFDSSDGHSGASYKIDSRMLIINSGSLSEYDGYEPGFRRYNFDRTPAVYEIKNDILKQIE